MPFLRHNETVKRDINGYHLTFLTFGFTLKSKILISNVDVYPLHAHDIKFNVDPLTPNQITFYLVDTKKCKFQDPHTC